MKLSFIVLTYQRPGWLLRCLASIYAQQDLPRPYEVIVIDNGGTGTIPPPPEPDIQLLVINNERNLGVAEGHNQGMKLARGEFWLLLDDDAEWQTSRDAAQILTLFEQNPRCAVVTVKSLDPVKYQPIMLEVPHPDKAWLLSQTRPTEIPYFYGYAHALRGEAGREVGFYPLLYGIYGMEDVDLSYRLIDAGYTILYAPNLAVIHHHASTGRPVQGEDYWRVMAVNKTRLAWRLLPWRYVSTTLLAWSVYALRKTRHPRIVLDIWRTLWRDRHLINRQSLSSATLNYLRRIGARLWY